LRIWILCWSPERITKVLALVVGNAAWRYVTRRRVVIVFVLVVEDPLDTDGPNWAVRTELQNCIVAAEVVGKLTAVNATEPKLSTGRVARNVPSPSVDRAYIVPARNIVLIVHTDEDMLTTGRTPGRVLGDDTHVVGACHREQSEVSSFRTGWITLQRGVDVGDFKRYFIRVLTASLVVVAIQAFHYRRETIV